MRDMKFRGQTIHSRVWAYGHYVQIEGRSYIILDDAQLGEDSTSFEEAIVGFIEVDPETVEQYTGLKDKNGRDIYEGDIAWDCEGKVAGVITYIVGYDDMTDYDVGLGYYVLRNVEIADIMCDSECLEVIGNIHENPELLEEK